MQSERHLGIASNYLRSLKLIFLLCCLFAAGPISAEQDAVLCPSFWGVDLTDVFPDWRGQFISLKTIFEGPDGALIARFDVAGGAAGSKPSEWDVDLVRHSKAPAGTINYRKIQIQPDNFASSASGNMLISTGARQSGGSTEPCEDPLVTTIELQKREGKGPYPLSTTTKSVMVVMKSYSEEGYEIGGYCGGKGYTAMKSMKIFAISAGSSLFLLPDHTAVLLAGDGKHESAILLRFDRDLTTRFNSPKFQIITVVNYESLLDEKGIFGAQKELLSAIK